MCLMCVVYVAYGAEDLVSCDFVVWYHIHSDATLHMAKGAFSYGVNVTIYC